MFIPVINEVNFRKILAKRKMTITDVAVKAEVSRKALSAGIHHGRINRMSTLGKIAEALDVELEEFVDFEEQ